MAEASEDPSPVEDPSPAEAAAPPPADPAARLTLAESLREEGNAKFKAQDAAGARTAYERALTLLRLPAEGEELKTRANALRVPVLLNLALCCLRAEPCEAAAALDSCEEVLDLEPENAKAMYRKAKALIELQELKEAEWELVRAVKLMPKDPAPRKDLEQLRQRMRESREKEKTTFGGLFERGPGFASDDRQSTPATGLSKVPQRDIDDMYFHDGDENRFEHVADPHGEALRLQKSGELGDAVLAWEASLAKTAGEKDWPEHFAQCLDFGRLFMDLNLDRLALRCFDKVLEPPADACENEPAPLAATRQRALLLKAVCLLNEAEGDPLTEVSGCLRAWLSPAEEESLETALQSTPGPDACVALGLLELLGGQPSAVNRFADALRAEEKEEPCFGRAVRWNMLGAVLANRKGYGSALLAYGQALALHPKYPRALVNRGLSLAGSGSLPAAAASYAEALAMLPVWGQEAVWPMLAKTAEDAAEKLDGLEEAVAAKNLTRSLELLAPFAQKPPAAPAATAQEVLALLELS